MATASSHCCFVHLTSSAEPAPGSRLLCEALCWHHLLVSDWGAKSYQRGIFQHKDQPQPARRAQQVDEGCGKHSRAEGMQSFPEEQLPSEFFPGEIFHRPPSALLLALIVFKWKCLTLGKKYRAERHFTPASFPHLLQGLILHVLPRQSWSQVGEDGLPENSKVGSKHRAASCLLCCFALV